MKGILPEPPSEPLQELITRTLPRGEPWGYVFAQRLLEARVLGEKVLREGLSPGLHELLQGYLAKLRDQLMRLRREHPLSDCGERQPTPAEQASLSALLSGSTHELENLFKTYGYSPFAAHSAFLFESQLVPVAHPDPVSFAELVGFERQITTLRNNVERFLSGKPSLATLLYGARGCGKSSVVKALRTAYQGEGLKLVEVMPDGLDHLSSLMESLRFLPQKFVLYLDDLTVDTGNRRFHKLKALLEGAVFARPDNVLVVATSNRRNLVQESWSDRPEPGAGDPTAWDTVQDKLALADRFGLVLTFPPFDQQLYLEVVTRLLGRPLDETAREHALRFALQGRGFSGRTARQFANWSS